MLVLERRSAIRYENIYHSRRAFYTNMMNFLQTDAVVFQERHLIKQIPGNSFYKTLKKTKWQAPIKKYWALANKDTEEKKTARAIVSVMFDLMLEGKEIELIPNTIFLRAVKCPVKVNKDFSQDIGVHLSYRSSMNFPAKGLISAYYMKGNKGHRYTIFEKFQKKLDSSGVDYKEMLGFNSRLKQEISFLKQISKRNANI